MTTNLPRFQAFDRTIIAFSVAVSLFGTATLEASHLAPPALSPDAGTATPAAGNPAPPAGSTVPKTPDGKTPDGKSPDGKSPGGKKGAAKDGGAVEQETPLESNPNRVESVQGGGSTPSKAPSASDPTVAKRPGDVIEPAAKAILDRAEKVSTEIRVLQLVTEYQSKTTQGAEPSIGSIVAPMKVTLQYPQRDSFSMPRLRVEPADASAGGLVVIYDGDGGAVLDLGKKLWYPTRSGFPAQSNVALLSLPHWIVDRRSKGILKTRSAGRFGSVSNEVVASQVVGTEVLDGEECDLVRSAIAFPIFDESDGAEMGQKPSSYARVLETVAFARKDGLPRRIHLVSEVPGVGPLGFEERTGLYTRLKLNEALPEVAFGLAKPEGFADGNARPAAPSGAPAVPPSTTPVTPPAK